MPLDTGIAAWQTISPAPLGPAVALAGNLLHPNWIAAPPGSSWVSQSGTDATGAPAAVLSYQLCFDLCSGFTPPDALQIQGLADDRAQVFLNGSSVGNLSGFSVVTTLGVPLNLLQAGRNCFQIDVTNDGGPTGFALAGSLQIIRGKCPCTSGQAAGTSPRRDNSAARKAALDLFGESDAHSKTR